MLAIGRALMAQPRILLLDEPSMGLAPILVDAIFETIQRINRKGTTILLVEHNMRLVQEISDRVLALNFGVVLAEGSPKEALEHPEVMKAYLGEEGVSA